MLSGIHFSEREVEGQGGFRALILTDALDVEAVTATAGAEIVKRQAEVVASEEPFESALGLLRAYPAKG